MLLGLLVLRLLLVGLDFLLGLEHLVDPWLLVVRWHHHLPVLHLHLEHRYFLEHLVLL